MMAGDVGEAVALGAMLGDEFLERGAAKILAEAL